MHSYSERNVRAFVAAARRLIDPGRAVMTASSPYMLTGGSDLDYFHVIGGGKAAGEIDADFIHMVFAPGAEMEGPLNVKVAMSRGNVVVIRMESRFWLDPRGRPFLIGTTGGKFCTMSFDPDGMDTNPGRPKSSLERGYARADKLLRRYAAEALAANVPMAA